MADHDRLGDCFKAAGDLVAPLLGFSHPALEDLTDIELVHGIVSGQGPLAGLRYTHAWVEGRSAEGIPMVVDASNGRWLTLPAALYYFLGKIAPEECERYTADLAQDRMLATAHYGPWDGAPLNHVDPVLGSDGVAAKDRAA